MEEGFFMYITYSHFTLIIPVGDLSDSKVDILKQTLNDYLEINRPNPQTITFRNGSSILTVQPNLIFFTAIEKDASEINIENISNELIKVKNSLGLSQPYQIQMILEGIEKSQENIMGKSKVPIPEAAKALDAVGIGYRFILNYNDFTGNAHINPYIEDKQKIIYNVDFLSKKTYQNEDMKSIFNQLFTLATSNTQEAAKKIFT